MEEMLMQQYELYLTYHKQDPAALERYLSIAEGGGVDPIFLKIMRLSDLNDDEKGEFVTIYCDAREIRNQRRKYQEQVSSVDPSKVSPVEYLPYVDPHDPRYYEHPYGENGERRPKSTLVVRGGKSRRRSNRKSRRKSRR